MSVKRMVDYHLKRLKDKRDDIRLDAIQELIHLEATEALAELEEVYHNDPNAKVRRAAKNAGKKLFTNQLLDDQDNS
jgi:HEAT repeat protein